MVFVCYFSMCICKVCAKNFKLLTTTWIKYYKTRQGVMKGSSWCFYVQFLPFWVVSKKVFARFVQKKLKVTWKNTGTQSCASANSRERVGTKIHFGNTFRGLLWVLTKAPGSLFSRSLANRRPQPWLTPLRRLNTLLWNFGFDKIKIKETFAL